MAEEERRNKKDYALESWRPSHLLVFYTATFVEWPWEGADHQTTAGQKKRKVMDLDGDRVWINPHQVASVIERKFDEHLSYADDELFGEAWLAEVNMCDGRSYLISSDDNSEIEHDDPERVGVVVRKVSRMIDNSLNEHAGA